MKRRDFYMSETQSPKPNVIHPTAIIDSRATLGEGNYIGPYSVIEGPVVIGNNNRLEAFCSIGLSPEHKEYVHGPYQSVRIGSDCIIREFVTINSGTTGDTFIGDHNWILRGAYIGHDAVIENHVTVSCNALIAGHVHVFEGANLGLNTVIHQYSRIGHYAMLGMSTVVTKKSLIEPFGTYVGNPARFLKKNEIGIKKSKLSAVEIQGCMDRFYQTIKVA